MFILRYICLILLLPGHAAAQWLRNCAKHRKVAELISDRVTGIFH
jgi:hypothetical protein